MDKKQPHTLYSMRDCFFFHLESDLELHSYHGALFGDGVYCGDVFSTTLPKSNSSPLKMDGWKIKRPFVARPIFRGYVSFMEGNWRAKSKEMI